MNEIFRFHHEDGEHTHPHEHGHSHSHEGCRPARLCRLRLL